MAPIIDTPAFMLASWSEDTVWTDDLERIYFEAFPPAERSPLDEVFLDDDTGKAWVAAVGGRVAGFATVNFLSGGVAVLSYLATEAALRNQGIGRRLLDALQPELVVAGYRRLLIEVEDPDDGAPDPVLAARRLGFYERWGARRLAGCPSYWMPDLDDPDAGAVPMLLLEQTMSGSGQLVGGALASALAELYEVLYGADAAARNVPLLLAGLVGGAG